MEIQLTQGKVALVDDIDANSDLIGDEAQREGAK